ncbi:MAG: 30S ribosomal protein S4, partial [Parcubacteria group bacterium]|nr:30S ribosomal protein S4 [Parcubacteria group bacterium]
LFKGLAERLQQHTLPSWLGFDKDALAGKVLSLPTSEDMRDTIEAKQIIEFYSRF